ncbi:hypothetical protein E1301_Tti006221 [Triplophysa tibetana]|uniref:Uncharacterized protein n=1 Tax=Triplophysa tibetana TaxID=1572043 RepID=A0A5A9NPQ8_9TELE|nr:hypothetical protein E1301_Tti006221 [Triplophysa tibetana]
MAASPEPALKMATCPEPNRKMVASPEPQAIMAAMPVVPSPGIPGVSVPEVLPLEPALLVVVAALLCVSAVRCSSAPGAVSEPTEFHASSKMVVCELPASSKKYQERQSTDQFRNVYLASCLKHKLVPPHTHIEIQKHLDVAQAADQMPFLCPECIVNI